MIKNEDNPEKVIEGKYENKVKTPAKSKNQAGNKPIPGKYANSPYSTYEEDEWGDQVEVQHLGDEKTYGYRMEHALEKARENKKKLEQEAKDKRQRKLKEAGK